MFGFATLVTTVLMVAGQWYKACNALEDQIRANLIQIAKAAAAQLDADLHKTFVRREQEDTEAYRHAVEPLRKIQQAIRQIKFIYTVVLVDGRIHFVLDPTPPGDTNEDGLDDHSFIMQPYDEDDPEMLAALTRGICLTNPQFRTDRWGTFLSGYAPFYDSQGRQVGAVGIDYTAQEYTEQAASMYREAYLDLARAILVSVVAGGLVYGLRKHIHANEEQHRHVFESVTDALLIVDRNRRIVQVNPAGCRMFGRSYAELLHLSVDDLSPAGDQRLPGELSSQASSSCQFSIEASQVGQDGMPFPVDIAGTTFRFRGKPHFLLIIRDISERKRIEEADRRHAEELQAANRELIAEKRVSDCHRQELVLANRQLNHYNLDLEAAIKALQETYQRAEDATRVKSQFLATMSHELRTPLNGVIGMAELLQSTELDPRQREFVKACHASGQTLLYLINDILDFSKIEAGKVELESHDFLLDTVVVETVEALNSTARKRGLPLTSYVAPALRRCVRGDSIRLRQVLVNLVSNAIKFTDVGLVSVSVDPVAADTAAPEMVRFTVSDTGIGIPPDRVDRLFKSFCQADSSTTRKYGGTGLGLAICKGLVELMGGEIGVESEPGRGSTFWFQIPLLPAAGEQRQVEDGVQPGITHGNMRDGLQGRRVLLAEDNHINQMFVLEVMRRAGVECCTAASGLQALAALERERFDLVLMDCQMPEMDGFEATRRIREWEREGRLSGHMPIIALTANAIKGDRERCLDVGMDSYVSKPFTPDTLVAAIAQMLAVQTIVQANEPQPPTLEATESAGGPIDCDALLTRCMGSLELAQQLLSEFGSVLPGHVERIAGHVCRGDARAVAESAHALKGAAGTLAAEPVRVLAAQIELAGKVGDVAGAAVLIDRLHDASRRCAAFIPAIHEELARR